MRFLLLAPIALLAACGDGPEAAPIVENSDEAQIEASGNAVSSFGNGVVTLDSEGGVDEAVARLKTALADNGFSVVAMLDHQDNAQGVDLTLNPATVVFFGKPEVGTFLMKASPSAALDLPQRMAIYETGEGQTVIAYNDPTWLATRHDVQGEDERLEKMSQALEMLAMAAAGRGDAGAADDSAKAEDGDEEKAND